MKSIKPKISIVTFNPIVLLQVKEEVRFLSPLSSDPEDPDFLVMSFEHSGTTAGSSAPGTTGGRGNSSSSSASGTSKEKQKEKARVSRTSMILWHAHQNDSAAVRKLLEEDQSLVHARDYDSRTPLHVASLHGWIDVAKCLIEHGADVNAQDRWKNTVSFIHLFYVEMIVYRNYFLCLYGSSITILRCLLNSLFLYLVSIRVSW